MKIPTANGSRPIVTFLRATMSGGILVMLPVALVVILATRAFEILQKISAPLASQMPEFFLGLDGSRLLTITIGVLLCFFTGLLVRSKGVRTRIGKLEELLMIYVPGYSMIKSIAADSLGQVMEGRLVPVLIEEDGAYNLGFLVEEKGPWATVFVPEAPRHDSGEVKIIASVHIKKLDMPSNLATRAIKNYGKGIAEWIPKTGM